MRRERPIRAIFALLFIIVMGALAIRTAVVSAYAEEEPAIAARVWPHHPLVLATTAMARVGEAAARGESPDSVTTDLIDGLAARSPLATEPFLIEGATAARAGDYERAERLLRAANIRHPRSVPGHYLLADLYLRQNRIPSALDELAILTRLSPSFSAPLAPALAQYAQTPGALAHLREVLEENPQLENVLLSELASDLRNANLVLALARDQKKTDTVAPWQQKLIATLIEAGAYDRAYAVWRAFGFASDLEDSFEFRRPAVQSTFSWSFAQESAGTAEPMSGRLEILFSGAKRLKLASKIARLPPGIYEMRTKIEGDAPESVRWSVICLPGDRQVVDAPLSRARSNILFSRFKIASDCRAQRFELQGQSETFPVTSEFSIVDFEVKQVASR